jgi:hypothetical protein
MRALAKDPADRYPDAGEMADALAIADVSSSARRPAPTRVGKRLAPRANFHPVERRRYLALLGAVIALLLAMLAAALLTSTKFVRVPNLRGLTRAGVLAKVRVHDLRALFTTRYATAPPGSVIAQHPGYGARVSDGTRIRVVFSAGLPPVEVPQLVGEKASDAQAILGRLQLVPALAQVPAPGMTPGLVVAQAPPAGSSRARRSTITLSVAETPRWRPLTSFSGDGPGQSVPFRIRGRRWRVLYSMAYDGTCAWILFCSGPSARVTGPATSQFDLNDGSGQTQVFNSGPGLYQITDTPGSDNARWSIEVEDDY